MGIQRRCWAAEPPWPAEGDHRAPPRPSASFWDVRCLGQFLQALQNSGAWDPRPVSPQLTQRALCPSWVRTRASALEQRGSRERRAPSAPCGSALQVTSLETPPCPFQPPAPCRQPVPFTPPDRQQSETTSLPLPRSLEDPPGWGLGRGGRAGCRPSCWPRPPQSLGCLHAQWAPGGFCV